MTPPNKAHWPRPNGARTHCLECGRPIVRVGPGTLAGYWQHVRRKGTGRPATPPRMPNVAAKALEVYREQDAIIAEATSLRNEALVHLLEAGMTTYQIARATGLGEGSVRYQANLLGHTPRRVGRMPPRTPKAAIQRRAESGSVLFGD